MELVNADLFRRLMRGRVTKVGVAPKKGLLKELEGKAAVLLRAIREFTGGQGDEAAIAREIRDRLAAALRLAVLADGEVRAFLRWGLNDDPARWAVLFGWLFVHDLGKAVTAVGFEQVSRSWLDEWQLGRMLASVLGDFQLDEQAADYAVTVVKLLTTHQCWFESGGRDRSYEVLSSLFRDTDVQRALQVNRYQGILWFNSEAFQQLLWWMFVVATVTCSAVSPERPAPGILTCWETVRKLQGASEGSGYQVEKLLEEVRRGENG
jgi:hypothetical protein